MLTFQDNKISRLQPVSPSILVMEDEMSVAKGLEIVLSEEGYAVDLAMTGREALDRLARKEFDLLVADLRLPDINGLDVIRQVKTQRPETGVVVITGYASVSSAVDAMKLGTFDYLPKPFTEDEIKTAVGGALMGQKSPRTEEVIQKVEKSAEDKLIQKHEVTAVLDRALLEGDPHAVLEGMLIAAYAIGAAEGYIYARAEYPLAIARLEKAIADMRDCGLLGKGILGSRFRFHVAIKQGAGAFVCGEETALMASIQGERGMPRPRPPFPAQSGLWGEPTTINNVETLGNVSAILQRGARWYSQYGTEASKGTKTFSLAGKIRRTGLIEVPLGISLGEIIEGIGGGAPEGKTLKAVQTGGPSGGCIPAERFDLPADYESLVAAGSIMGSGGMVVMDQDTCMVDVARYFLSFTQAESCGKCLPCRLGTRQMLDILEDICHGRGQERDLELLADLSETVQKGSLCGLGQTAPNPVLSTLRYFREEYESHVRQHGAPHPVSAPRAPAAGRGAGGLAHRGRHRGPLRLSHGLRLQRSHHG